MDDDSKKRSSGKGPRKPGARPPAGGFKGPRPGGAKGGKPGFAAGKAEGAARKPYVKRERPEGDGGERPFRKPFVRRERSEDGANERPAPRRFAKAAEGEGGFRKPFAARERRDADTDGERRPPRRFGKESEGGSPGRKPFVRRDRDERQGGSERPAGRSFEKRGDGKRPFDGEKRERFGDRPARLGRRERAAGGESEGASREAAGRPQRRFDGEKPRRPEGTGDRPFRSAPRPGGKPFEKREGPRREGAAKPFVRREREAEEPAGERIAKRLARVGIASRRDAEDLVAAGRIRVNGRVLDTPAFNVTAEDVIELDGAVLPPIERTRLFLFHKPAGVVTTNRDPDGRRTVFDVLPQDLPRVVTVGRLDINTEGLLLLTNDGGLARTLELPATGWLRRYRVRVHGKVDEQRLAGLKEGIAVDGVFYGSVEATLDREQGSNAWLTIGLREGKNREVKNILGALGLEVGRLIRVSFGPFQLGDLPEGHVQELKGKLLREQLGERLIEESGANFEADIVKPFSNRPVRREKEAAAEPARPKVVRDGIRGREGEGGLIKARKRREDGREEALGKLSTRPERGFKEGGDRPERGPRKPRERPPIEPPGQRKANVWMAPGARPMGKGRAAAEAAAKDKSPRGGKPAGKPRGNPDGRGPRPGRPPRKD